jgi:hypothetical protein
MDIALFKKLHEEQLVSDSELQKIEQQQQAPVPVYWEVTTLLYAGILLLSTGLGILVYKNLDTIGHTIIVVTIGVLCAACFTYCFSKSKGFSLGKTEAPGLLHDYILLLGCLLMLSFVGYLQFAYNVFGSDYGLATFVPMVVLFVAAYYFDHLGVLSMAITALATWAGFTVAPLKILGSNDFGNEHLVITGLILGAGLIAIAFVSLMRGIKEHFAFTYRNFGTHILFISLLAAMFHFDAIYLVLFLGIGIVAWFYFKYAVKERSFYFLVVTVLYAYVALTYVFTRLLFNDYMLGASFYLGFIYFIGSGIGLIKAFIHYNKLFKHDAHL